MAKNRMSTRAASKASLTTRASENYVPKSYDEDKHSIKVIATTEEPATVFDYERFAFVKEVLMMDGMTLPKNKQVPLLDSHNRDRASDVLGSLRNITVNKKNEAEGDIFFTSEQEGRSAEVKISEGHLTDVSVGYEVIKSTWIEEGKSKTIKGREFTGPLKVSTKWKLKELSITPIGADEFAKVRAENIKPTETPKPKKEISNMNAKLRALLIKRGLDSNASIDDAWEYFRKLSEADQTSCIDESAERKTPDPVDPTEFIEQGRKAEQERQDTIRTECQAINMKEDFIAAQIKTGEDIETVRKAMLVEIGKNAKAISTDIQVGTDERDKFRAAATDGLSLRAGVVTEKPAPGHDGFRARKLLRIAEECLIRAGVNTGSLSDNQLVRRAFSHSSSDFPYLLAAVANKVLRNAYDIAPSTYQLWCNIVQASDFKTMNRLQLSEAADLPLITAGGEYTETTFSELKEAYNVNKYGMKFAATWEMTVDDDLNSFIRIPRAFGSAAKRKENSLAYGILTTNANMSDTVALFHATHSNLGSAAAIGETPLGEARKLMRKQTDLNGSTILNVMAKYLLVPAALETAADILLRSQASTISEKNVGVLNPFVNSLTPVVDAILDGSSATAYYFVADYNQIDTVEVAFLDGEQGPFLEEKKGFDIDGVELKVRHVIGAKAIDWRGMVKNAGA